MSEGVALHPVNKDTASARGRRDVKSRSRSVGKQQVSVQPMPPWKSQHPATARETRPLRGATARTTRGKEVGPRIPHSAPESRFPSAPAPSPRALTPQSANERRRPPSDFSQQKFSQINQPNSTAPQSVGRKSLKGKAKRPRRDDLLTKEKEKKKSSENDNYPEAMKSAENSASSLITNIMKNNKRKEKECAWKLFNHANMVTCIPVHSVTVPKGMSYNTVTRKPRRRGVARREMEKSARPDDSTTLKSAPHIDPATQEIELITVENEDYKDIVHGRGVVPIKETTPKNRNSKDVPPTRFFSVRRTTMGGKTESLKGAVTSEGAAATRVGNTGRRDRTSPKAMAEKPTEKPVSPVARQMRPSVYNRTSSPKVNVYTEEGLKKRPSKATLKDMHLISYMLPSIPEGQPSDGGNQSYYSALRNLVSWKDSVRTLDSKINEVSAAAAVPTEDNDLPSSKAKDRSQAQKSMKNTSRTVSDKIRSSYVKQNNLLLMHGTGESIRSQPRRKSLYPKELMSASDSESESKVKYNPSYIHPSVSMARANNFKRFLNFNIVLPGSSAEIYPWYMSNDRVHYHLPKTKRTI